MPSSTVTALLRGVVRLLLVMGGLLIHFLPDGVAVTGQLMQVSREPVYDYGGFYMMNGKGLNPNQTYAQRDFSKRCHCRRLCHEASSCKAYSVWRLNADLFRCYLAKENVFVNTPGDMKDQFYAVRKEVSWMLGTDNLVYRRLSATSAGFNVSKVSCETIPGHRLVAPRFQAQMPVLLELCLGRPITAADTTCGEYARWFFVDLVKRDDGMTMVGGKIPLNQTDLVNVAANENNTKVFIYAHSLSLHDENDSHIFRPVCQANVFNVNW